MTKILIVECKQEVLTFYPQLSGYDGFAVRRGAVLLRSHRSVRNEVGGALSLFDAQAGHRGRVSFERPRRAAGGRHYFWRPRNDC